MKRKIIIIALALVLVLLPSIALAQSTVDGAMEDIYSITFPYQRMSFYANGRYWAFWEEGEHLYYNTSVDGGSWGTPAAITALAYCNSGWDFDIFYDSTNDYFHYVYVDRGSEAATPGLNYRMGRPEANGTITWAAAEQDIPDYGVGSGEFQRCSISIDTNGYPWVTAARGSTNRVVVIKSSTKDGTWTLDPWFPDYLDLTLGGGGITVVHSKIVPLTGGKMLCIWPDDNATDKINVSAWANTVDDDWTAERATTSTIEEWGSGKPFFSAVAIDDDVHIVFLEDVSNDIIHTKYSYSTNSFGAETVLQTSTTSTSAPVITKDALNNLYVFWENAPTDDHVYYKKYDAAEGTWGDTVDWIDESVLDGLPSLGFTLNTDYYANGILSVYYTADPQKLKVKTESLLSVDTLEPQTLTSTTASLRGEIIMLGVGSVTTRGFQYGLTETPTWTESETGSFGMGVFSLAATGFESDTIYHVRAYATDSQSTEYGDWVAFLTGQQGTDQPDEPDDGMLPPVPTKAPGGWIIPPDDKTFDTWPGSDLINTFADMVSRSFVWFLLTVATIVGVGLLLTRYTRHLGIVFLTLGVVLGVFISGQYLDWWIIFPYLIVGIALVIKEQNMGIGF